MRISTLSRGVSGSETMAIAARVSELKREGVDVVSFVIGEPDFNTPDFILEAARHALAAGHTRYTAASGIPELRAALAEKTTRDLGRPTQPAEVVVTAGAKQALALSFQVLIEPDDEVLVPSPYWVSIPQQILLCRGVPVPVPTLPEDGFELRRDAIEALLTPRTRGIVINSPCNPTGAVYGKTELQRILELAAERDLWVVSDETYEALVYENRLHVSPAALSDDARSRTVVTGSFSKTYAMTGWRVGYLVAPPEVAAAAGRVASHTTSNANSIAQWAALAALSGPPDLVESMRRTFDERRRALIAGLRKIEGMTCGEPFGAFYAFPNVQHYLKPGSPVQTSLELAEWLLERAGVATVPGSAFGAEGYLRLSYATSLESIERGLTQMDQALSELR